MLTWVAFSKRQEMKGPFRVIVGVHFLPPCFASVHCPETGHQVVGSQSPDHGTLGPKAAPSPSEADEEQHSALLAQSSGLSQGGLAGPQGLHCHLKVANTVWASSAALWDSKPCCPPCVAADTEKPWSRGLVWAL